AAQARPDHQLRVARADHRQAVGAFQQPQDLLHRLDQVAVEVVGDELGDDLGVGVGAEGDALGLELALQGGVVLDDAVVDNGDQAVAFAGGVRVGVGVGGGAVGGPAGVRDADRAGGGRVAQVLGQLGDAAGPFAQVQF